MSTFEYLKRATLTLGLLLVGAGTVYLLATIANIVLVLFASVLLAVLLDTLASWLHAKTNLPRRGAVGLTALLLLGILVGLGWLVGPGLAAQFQELSQRLPEALDRIESWIRDQSWGQQFLQDTPSADSMVSSGAVDRLTRLLSSTLSTVFHIGLLGILGFYMAMSPALYKRGALKLLPSARRARGEDVLTALSSGLRSWLLGRLIAMMLVGTLTSIGLWIIGMPLILSLGVIAALFAFIPFIGPVFTFVPVLLVAFTETPNQALPALIVCFAVQVLESNVITPLVQRYAVSIPPALLISAQLIMAGLLGISGIMLATPITVVVIILVQLLYLQDVLHEPVQPLGNSHGSKANAPAP